MTRLTLLTSTLLLLLLCPAQAQEKPHLDLMERGIIQGYENGEFKGERAITRNELLKTLQILDDYLSRQHRRFAPRESLRKVEGQARALDSELRATQSRTENLEAERSNLQERKQEARY